jgi:predicted nucleotide-binding protein
MPRKQTPESLPPPNLIVPRDDAAAKIKAQIEKGIQIRDTPIRSEPELSKAWADEDRWSKFNTELLTRLFDNPSIAQEYDRSGIVFGQDRLDDRIVSFREHVAERINRLESIRERLDLIPEKNERRVTAVPARAALPLSRDIFIVHGHDEAVRETVARFIERLGLHPIILHEQPNAGRTLIEKFERNADVSFAVVLLTPDDIGYPKDQPELARPRARQNVIFELGYFLGRLDRAKVCALYKGDVEILSDYQGVVYIPIDTGGAWRFLLAKEIREVGIDIDLNKAL